MLTQQRPGCFAYPIGLTSPVISALPCNLELDEEKSKHAQHCFIICRGWEMHSKA
jgi:hypothetical protein